jgi:hypothetical protein
MARSAKAPLLEPTLEGEVVSLTRVPISQEQFEQVAAYVRARGGKLTSDLSKDSNTVLVAAEASGAKVEFARAHGIPCVDPSWLGRRLRGETPSKVSFVCGYHTAPFTLHVSVCRRESVLASTEQSSESAVHCRIPRPPWRECLRCRRRPVQRTSGGPACCERSELA